MTTQFRYSIGLDDICPKCGDNADPRLVYGKKTTTLPEGITVYCATCGYTTGVRQPCADAPVVP